MKNFYLNQLKRFSRPAFRSSDKLNQQDQISRNL